MSHHSLLDTHLSNDSFAETLEDTILEHIKEQAVIGLDALDALLPEYSWSQVFHAIDRLTRHGRITLRRHRSEYTVFSSDSAA